MTLREKQSKFVVMLALLIRRANALGYELTLGCGRCHLPGHHMEGSLHYLGLAQDLNLFKDGVWLKDGTGHDVLHQYWSSIGGAEMIPGDSNHYSLEHLGRR
jgi:hypothetical protein